MFEDYVDKHQRRCERIDLELQNVTNDEEAFCVRRKKGLGGSDMSALLGLSKWKTPFKLWCEKTDRTPAFKGNLATAVGHWCEDFVAQAYEKLTGYKTVECNPVTHKDKPFLVANFDRLVVSDDKVIKGLECKTTGYNFSVFDLKGRERAKWGEQNVYANHELVSSSDEIDPEYYAQVQFYLSVSGLFSWDVGVLINNNDLRFYTVKRDEAFIANMLKKAEEFWCYNVLDDNAPEQTFEDLKEAPAEPVAIEASDELIKACQDYKAIKAEIAALEDKLKEPKNLIAKLLKNNEKATVMSEKGKAKTLVSFKGMSKSSLDKKSFMTDCPQSYNDYKAHLKSTQTARILRVY